ncbi:MAG: hypothetical protein ABIS51_02815 [Sphingomonas sp.]
MKEAEAIAARALDRLGALDGVLDLPDDIAEFESRKLMGGSRAFAAHQSAAEREHYLAAAISRTCADKSICDFPERSYRDFSNRSFFYDRT